MIDLVFQEMMNEASEISQNNKYFVLDHSVGDGRFLFSFHSHWTEMGFNDRELYLHGLDINTDSIMQCFLHKNTVSTEYKVKFDFKKGNALIGYCNNPQ